MFHWSLLGENALQAFQLGEIVGNVVDDPLGVRGCTIGHHPTQDDSPHTKTNLLNDICVGGVGRLDGVGDDCSGTRGDNERCDSLDDWEDVHFVSFHGGDYCHYKPCITREAKSPPRALYRSLPSGATPNTPISQATRCRKSPVQRDGLTVFPSEDQEPSPLSVRPSTGIKSAFD